MLYLSGLRISFIEIASKNLCLVVPLVPIPDMIVILQNEVYLSIQHKWKNSFKFYRIKRVIMANTNNKHLQSEEKKWDRRHFRWI